MLFTELQVRRKAAGNRFNSSTDGRYTPTASKNYTLMPRQNARDSGPPVCMCRLVGGLLCMTAVGRPAIWPWPGGLAQLAPSKAEVGADAGDE